MVYNRVERIPQKWLEYYGHKILWKSVNTWHNSAKLCQGLTENFCQQLTCQELLINSMNSFYRQWLLVRVRWFKYLNLNTRALREEHCVVNWHVLFLPTFSRPDFLKFWCQRSLRIFKMIFKLQRYFTKTAVSQANMDQIEQDQKDLSNLPSYRVINCYTLMF